MTTRSREELLEQAVGARRESKYLDFKESFDPLSKGEWCEMVKDMVAMANTGGGVLVVGVRNNATPSTAALEPVLELDLAKVTDQVHRYTGEHFSDVDIHEIRRDRKRAAAVVVGAVQIPLAFTAQGAYQLPNGKQKVAFQRGTVYFRHGAKSEPATRSDLADFVERRLHEVRESWLGGIRQVVSAPAGTEFGVYQRTASDAAGRPTRFRLTTERGAPVFGLVDPDDSHPYRQKEVVQQVNERLPGRRRPVNTHDLLSVRRAHDITADSKPEFANKRIYGSTQYSDAFVDWLLGRYQKDNRFFEKARDRYYDLTH